MSTLIPHTVVAILEAKPDCSQALEDALKVIVAPSRAEETNLEYRLHQSKNNPCEFILYENWTSEEKHQEQFQKLYIIELANKLENLLAKPYQVFFAKEI